MSIKGQTILAVKKGNNSNILRAINSKIIFHDEKFKQRNWITLYSHPHTHTHKAQTLITTTGQINEKKNSKKDARNEETNKNFR